MDSTLQVWPHQGRVKGEDHLPQPADHMRKILWRSHLLDWRESRGRALIWGPPALLFPAGRKVEFFFPSFLLFLFLSQTTFTIGVILVVISTNKSLRMWTCFNVLYATTCFLWTLADLQYPILPPFFLSDVLICSLNNSGEGTVEMHMLYRGLFL